ncbi:MAG: type VII toxin-antitoxin system MntA family adenylyltransferase antitoxin [Candidatus Asgardarchaeia archaeon]
MEKIKYYTLSQEERIKIEKKIKDILSHDENIIFAFIHGSFISGNPFRDIDIAVFLKDEKDAFSYVTRYSAKIEIEIKYPIDLHVLNEAPLTFQYHAITKGKLLLSRDELTLDLFIERTLKKYWDFKILLEYI